MIFDATNEEIEKFWQFRFGVEIDLLKDKCLPRILNSREKKVLRNMKVPKSGNFLLIIMSLEETMNWYVLMNGGKILILTNM